MKKKYIHIRLIVINLLILLEIIIGVSLLILGILKIPYFWLFICLIKIICIVKILTFNNSKNYKIAWILLILLLPLVGLVLFFLTFNRQLSKKYQRRMQEISNFEKTKSNTNIQNSENFQWLCDIADTHLYTNTKAKYYSLGEDMWKDMLGDLKKATKFIFIEIFSIEFGEFWNSILAILREKVQNGILVRVIYDDIGCSKTLPENYDKTLKEMGIECIIFSKIKSPSIKDLNNRGHRKMIIIDGIISYTGGINFADEYVNLYEKYGHWKDGGVKLEGNATNELTYLFLKDYEMNKKGTVEPFESYYKYSSSLKEGCIIPFGDGPTPLYQKRVTKTMIINLINHAQKYIYITTPYIMIDNELINALKNASQKGIDIRIIIPHIPDKKMIFKITKSYGSILMKFGIKIYEYKPGFMHTKAYFSDDIEAIIGTSNLDYRSLIHHFEDNIYFYRHSVIESLKKDFINTLEKSIYMNEITGRRAIHQRLLDYFLRIFASLL